MEDKRSEGKWIQFNNVEEENIQQPPQPPAVIEPSVQLSASPSHPKTSPKDHLQNIQLDQTPISTNQQQQQHSNTPHRNNGFANGDVIVSILPINQRFPWITPATFRPELVPEELMAPGLTLTVEDFVNAMDQLTTDFRFNAYTICYKRLLAAWLSTAFLILLIILFSGLGGIGLFALGISWLILNAGAVFLTMYIKIRINRGLEKCMARVNRILMPHKLILGLDDRGRLSCHKVHLCFIYFDPTDCIKRLDEIVVGSQNPQQLQTHLDVETPDIVIQGSQNVRRVAPVLKQKGESLFLRYIQRWAKDYLRRRLDWTTGEGSENPSAPRHLTSALCPCQYVQEYLRHKPINVNSTSTTFNDCSSIFHDCLPIRKNTTPTQQVP